MRLVFFGTPSFAVPSLKQLIQSHHRLVAVVTMPDRPRGRNQQPSGSPIKETALSAGLPLLQPEQLDSSFEKTLVDNKPDCAVVVAYGSIFKPSLLGQFPKGTYNLHASLLPRWRGAAPIQWALLSGDEETGVTIFQLDGQVDHGPIVSCAHIQIAPTDTTTTLGEKLSILGSELLIQTLDSIEQGTFQARPQEESKTTLAPRLQKEDGLIHWNLSAQQLHNRVRALQPWPGATTRLNGKLLKLFLTEPHPQGTDSPRQPGRVLLAHPQEGLWIQTGQGRLKILQLQEEGGKILQTKEFLAGHPISPGISLGK